MMGFGKSSDRPWAIGRDEAEPIVRAAVEGGVTFFDTADAYNGGASEVATGKLVSKFMSRDEAVVATKVFMPVTPGENGGGLSRKHILSGIDASLERLALDYVDLYQIHRWDPRTPIEETMGALHDVVRSGKARYIGASSMFSWQFAKAQYTAEKNGWTKFVSMQNHYNLIYREEEREMIPLCIDQGVGVIPWSPQQVAAGRGVPTAQVALAWLLGKPGVTAPIVGSTKLGHIEDALAAEELTLTDDEVATLEKAYVAHPVLGHF
jgi:aryl-alcohol dehydrogenase-like predicted oxidoreductase